MAAFNKLERAKVYSKVNELPLNMVRDLQNTFHTEKCFNKWSYLYWVPYSLRKDMLRQVETLL